LRDFQQGCTSEIPGQTAKLKTQIQLPKSDARFIKYGEHIKNMIQRAADTQTKLLSVISKLFVFVDNENPMNHSLNKRKIRVNPELNNNNIQSVVDEARNVIVELYLGCEKDYLEGVKIYESLVEKIGATTLNNQVEYLKREEEELMRETEPMQFKPSEMIPEALTAAAVASEYSPVGAEVEGVDQTQTPPPMSPDQMQEQMPDQTPDQMQEQTPDQMPEQMQEQTPDQMQEQMQDQTPDQMQEQMQDQLPLPTQEEEDSATLYALEPYSPNTEQRENIDMMVGDNSGDKFALKPEFTESSEYPPMSEQQPSEYPPMSESYPDASLPLNFNESSTPDFNIPDQNYSATPSFNEMNDMNSSPMNSSPMDQPMNSMSTSMPPFTSDESMSTSMPPFTSDESMSTSMLQSDNNMRRQQQQQSSDIAANGGYHRRKRSPKRK